MIEAFEGGWIDKLPRIASVQASGANPFYRGFTGGFRERFRMQAETVASAIRIGDPVSWDKARAVIDRTRGVVTEVTDETILEAKAKIDGAGIGCEPASACSLAGARRLRAEGVIGRDESVVAILTGNLLKDPEIVLERVRRDCGARMIEIDANVDEVARVLG